MGVGQLEQLGRQGPQQVHLDGGGPANGAGGGRELAPRRGASGQGGIEEAGPEQEQGPEGWARRPRAPQQEAGRERCLAEALGGEAEDTDQGQGQVGIVGGGMWRCVTLVHADVHLLQHISVH